MAKIEFNPHLRLPRVSLDTKSRTLWAAVLRSESKASTQAILQQEPITRVWHVFNCHWADSNVLMRMFLAQSMFYKAVSKRIRLAQKLPIVALQTSFYQTQWGLNSWTEELGDVLGFDKISDISRYALKAYLYSLITGDVFQLQKSIVRYVGEAQQLSVMEAKAYLTQQIIRRYMRPGADSDITRALQAVIAAQGSLHVQLAI